MKKLACALMITLPFLGYAQPTDKDKGQKDVEIEINDTKVIIEAEDLEGLSQLDLNNLISEATKMAMTIQKQHDELIAQVDQQLAQGEITEEEAARRKELINERTEESMELVGEVLENWGERYEERMEAWGDEYEASIEAWEEEVEARAEKGDYSFPPLPPIPPVPSSGDTRTIVESDGDSSRTVIIDEDGIRIQRSEDGDEPFALRWEEEDEEHYDDSGEHKSSNSATEGYGDIHFGFVQMLRGGDEFITDGDEELNFFHSNDFNIGFGGKTRIGKVNSPLYIKYGLEIAWYDFVFRNSSTFIQKDEDGVSIGPDTIGNIRPSKSKYKTVYFNVPVMLQLDFSEGNARDQGFTLGVGGYMGIRGGFKRKMTFSSDVLSDAKEVLKDPFYSNQYRYGVMAQIGFGSFKITSKYDINNFFQDRRGPDYQMASITIGWTM